MIITRTIVTSNYNVNLLIEEMLGVALVLYLKRFNYKTGLIELDVNDSWASVNDAELDAVILAHDPTPIISSSTFQYWEPAIGIVNSVGTDWVEGFNEIATKLSEGFYQIHVGFELRGQTGGLNSRALAQLSINGNNKANWILRNVGSDWMTLNGFDLQSYNNGSTPTIKIEFKRGGGTDVVQFRRVRVVLQRIE